MKKAVNPLRTMTKFEWRLWIISLIVVTVSYFTGGKGSVLSLLASLFGVSALIFVAKGMVVGQILSVIFALLYATVSLQYHYWGEMITYLCMSAPASLMAVITWLRHPDGRGQGEVRTAHMSAKKTVVLLLLSLLVTIGFYFMLRFFVTPNLIISTISIFTSFLASSLLILRSPYYAIAYASNDIVLIILWILATISSLSYLPMVLCFVMFLANDLYGFYNWRKMQHKQEKSC